MSGTLNGVSVRINALGFRGAEMEKEKEPGALRIVVLGDSVVFGQGVEEKDTLPVRLQGLLAKKFPQKKWDLINAGVRGYNIADYRIVLEHRIIPLQADLVILVLTEINDPERTPFVPSSDKLKRWEHSPWIKLPLMEQLVAGPYAREVNRLFVEHVRALYQPEGEEWKLFLQDLDAIRSLCRRHDLALVTVAFPMLAEEDMFREERGRLQRALSDLGLVWVDPLPAFRQYPAKELVVSRQDFHPNALALGVLAEMLTMTVAGELPPERN
jgi:hypothetical protein